jgi:hypothetical protein
MNRLQEYFQDQPEEEEPQGDYYTVDTRSETFYVSRDTARAVEQTLDAAQPPRWVVFHDLSGARHRLATHLVERVSECSAAHRASLRAFYRARRLEEKADSRPWEEE